MWRDNPLWGQKRIAAELGKLGWFVSPRTVAKYRPRKLDRQRGQRWSTFVRNHVAQTWAVDFFTIITVRFRLLYVFVVLSLERRRIVHVGVTAHPTGRWTAQRIVEAVGAGAAPRFLVHDRDAIYDSVFRQRVEHLGVRQLVTHPHAPTANAFAERVIGTLRRDCLDHLLVWDERHAERLLREYVGYYHGRPHRGLHLQPSAGARWLKPARPAHGDAVVGIPVLGGLHHVYAHAPPRAPPAIGAARG